MSIEFAKIVTIDEANIESIFFDLASDNDSPFDKKYGSGKFLEAPKYIYFYKIYFDGSRIKVDHYFWHQGEPTDGPDKVNALGAIKPRNSNIANGEIGIDEALKNIATIAHKDTSGSSPWKRSTGEDFNDPRGSGMLLWTIRSYVAFMIDDDAWEILRLNGKPAITFDDKNPQQGIKGNHSFYDTFDDSITVDAGNRMNRNVVCMLNHMKYNRAGDDLMAPSTPGHGRQNFKFNIFAKVKLQGWDEDNRRQLIVMIDPPGGNEGPPGAP
jgi:hypothetical protein